MVIGVPSDLGGLRSTYRIEFVDALAEWLADDLHYTTTPLAVLGDSDRAAMLRSGQVDMIITSDPMTEPRRSEVSFAGPYMLTQGGLMIRTDNNAVHAIGDLAGRAVCAGRGSVYEEQLIRLGFSVNIENGLSECVDALLLGRVDAVAGDQIALAEIASFEEGKLSVVPGLTFGGQQRYGIELAHGNSVQCNEIRDGIRRFITSGAWDDAFQAHMRTVPPAGHKPDPDLLDRCE